MFVRKKPNLKAFLIKLCEVAVYSWPTLVFWIPLPVTRDNVLFNYINIIIFAKFEVFTAVKIQAEIFWAVTPCRVAAG
jgi:hypothetical protein